MNDFDLLKSQIESLHAETSAFQLILLNVLVNVRNTGVLPAGTLEKSFDQAADMAETFAIMFGKKAANAHTVGALKIIEQLRAQFMEAK